MEKPKIHYINLTVKTIQNYCYRAGGTAGAVLTCPLEVLKTRLQSSKKSLLTDHRLPIHEIPQHIEYYKSFHSPLRPSLLRRVKMYEIFGRIFITSGGPACSLVTERADYTTALMRHRLGIFACFRFVIPYCEIKKIGNQKVYPGLVNIIYI